MFTDVLDQRIIIRMAEVNCELAPDTFCGACCKDVKVALSGDEALHLRTAGTRLIPILSAWQRTVENSTTPLPSWNDEDGRAILEERIEQADTEYTRNFWQRTVEFAKSLQPGEGIFIFDGACGFLQENGSCGSYEDRPNVCRSFPPGGIDCLGFRERAGISTPVSIPGQRRASIDI